MDRDYFSFKDVDTDFVFKYDYLKKIQEIDIKIADFISSETRIDYYELADDLIFLLRLYVIVNDRQIIDKVISIIHLYTSNITQKTNQAIYLGLGFISFELYKFTNDKAFIDNALKIIRYENATIARRNGLEKVIAKNILTCLHIFHASQYKEAVLLINVLVAYLLKFAVFDKSGINWPTLHRLDVTVASRNKKLIKLTFLELYRSFKNETFFWIAKKINIRNSTHKSSFYHRKNAKPLQEVLSLIQELENSEKDLTWLTIKIENIVNQETFANYPTIMMSKDEAQLSLLSNTFPKTITLLRTTCATLFNTYIQKSTFRQNRDEATAFIEFTGDIINSKPKLAHYIKPVLKLELLKLKLFKRYMFEPYGVQEIDRGNAKTNLLTIPIEDFIQLKFVPHPDDRRVSINYHRCLKVYIFTIDGAFRQSKDCVISLRYNNSGHYITELALNNFHEAVLKAFKKERTAVDVADKVLRDIKSPNSQYEANFLAIINIVRELVSYDLLRIKEEL